MFFRIIYHTHGITGDVRFRTINPWAIGRSAWKKHGVTIIRSSYCNCKYRAKFQQPFRNKRAPKIAIIRTNFSRLLKNFDQKWCYQSQLNRTTSFFQKSVTKEKEEKAVESFSFYVGLTTEYLFMRSRLLSRFFIELVTYRSKTLAEQLHDQMLAPIDNSN